MINVDGTSKHMRGHSSNMPRKNKHYNEWTRHQSWGHGARGHSRNHVHRHGWGWWGWDHIHKASSSRQVWSWWGW